MRRAFPRSRPRTLAERREADGRLVLLMLVLLCLVGLGAARPSGTPQGSADPDIAAP